MNIHKQDSLIDIHVSSWLVQLTANELYKLNEGNDDFIIEEPSQLMTEYYTIQCEFKNGERYILDHQFKTNEGKANVTCEKIKTYVSNGGCLNLDYWTETDPCYGSKAYCNLHGF